MKKIEAIVRPTKLDDIKNALDEYGIIGLTVTDVKGAGMQRGHTETYRGHEYQVNLLPKLMIELVVSDKDLEPILSLIQKAAFTGEVGDGKIFVEDIERVIRIRTGDEQDAAL